MSSGSTWGLRYVGYINNQGLGECQVNIYKQDYTGQSGLITIKANGLDIAVDSKDYFEPIISTNITLQIVNNKENFYEFDELFCISDLEYLVTVFSDTLLLFRGYIPCAVVEQTWLKRGIITLNATCNLNRLSSYTPTILNILGAYTLMDIITNCLSFTEMNLPIWVNCSLQAFNRFGGYTCFDETWIDSDLYNKNSVEKRDCRDVLESILKSFSCVIYYYNDRWYIERLKDIGGVSNSYTVYNEDSYQEIQVVANTTLELGANLKYCNTSQTIKYIPGLRQIEVTIQQLRRYNYVHYFFDNITKVEPLATLELDSGVQNKWHTTNEAYVTTLASRFYKKINSCIQIVNSYSANAWDAIDESVGHEDIQLRNSLIGIITRFPLELNLTGNTSLTISFKFYLHPDFLAAFSYFVSDSKIHPDDHIFFARFYIGLPFGYYVIWNENTSAYEFRYHNDLTVLYGTGGTHGWGVLSIPIPFSSFTDKENYYHEFSKTIELNRDMPEDSLVASDSLWTLGICQMGYNNPVYAPSGTSRYNKPNYSPRGSIYGDITITASDDLGNNLIIGTISKDFVDIEQIEVDLCDTSNYSIGNAMYLDDGTGGKEHTTTWDDAINPDHDLSLIKHLIEDYFQLRNKVRREITSDIYALQFLKPFTLINAGLKIYCEGTIHVIANNIIIGTGTHFTTDFVIGDYIILEEDSAAYRVRAITNDVNLQTGTETELIPAVPINATERIYWKKGLNCYINGYRYNLDSDIYYSVSLKEYIDDDGATS